MRDKPEIALIDADLWTYDIPFAAQSKRLGGDLILPFSYCLDRLRDRIQLVLERTSCTEYKMFLTGKGNFREDVAVSFPYKGTRPPEKPYHYRNMRMYMELCENAVVVNGMEADDALSIEQTRLGDRSCIVSRDKDLRITPGYHYSYTAGNQAEKPLEYIFKLGYLTLSPNRKKIGGGGLKFFYSQLLTGDSTDNIKGIRGQGPAKAYDLLNELTTEKQLFMAVQELYVQKYAEEANTRLLENGRLLWMVNEIKDNKPVMWEIPTWNY